MNFKERFKGKTSTISKEGIEGVISNTKTPIKKEYSSNSSSPLPLISSATSILLDQSPKQKSLIPLKSTTHQKLDASSRVSGFERVTPKANTFTSGSHIYSFQPQPIQIKQQKNSFLLNRLSEISPERNSRLQQSPLLFRENQNSSKEFISHLRDNNNTPGVYSSSDFHSNHYNPNSFYDQHAQFRSSNGRKEGIQTQKSFNEVISVNSEHQNQNQMHKKNFEILSQQNKQRQLSQDMGRGLVSKNQMQQYFNSSIEEGRESKPFHNTQNTERGSTQSPKRTMNTPTPYGFEEERISEYHSKEQFAPQDYRNSLVNTGKGLEALVLNKLRYRKSDSMDMNDYKGRFGDNRRHYESRKSGEYTTPMKNISDNTKFGNFQSISEIFMRKNHSEAAQGRVDSKIQRI